MAKGSFVKDTVVESTQFDPWHLELTVALPIGPTCQLSAVWAIAEHRAKSSGGDSACHCRCLRSREGRVRRSRGAAAVPEGRGRCSRRADEARAALYNSACCHAKLRRWQPAVDAISAAVNDYDLKLTVAINVRRRPWQS